MAPNHVKELEEKVALYETVMSSCPQCKEYLRAPEAEIATASSRNTRSSRPAQKPAAKVPSKALTGSPERQTPAATLSLSARPSQQLDLATGTELQTRETEQVAPSVSPTASLNQQHQTTVATTSTRRNPALASSVHPDVSSVTASAGYSSSGQISTVPPTPSNGSSSIAPSAADIRRLHGGEVVTLGLEQYKKPRPRNQPPRHAEWMRSADIMLEQVPSGRQWREKISKMDNSVIAAVAISATPNPKGDVSASEDVGRKELIRLVRRFAEQHSEGRVNFEHFILVCLCNVLSSQGVPQNRIVETLQICISDTGKDNINRYLKGAIWVNKLVDELFHTDWGYRAVDLIVIWNRSVSTYGKLASPPNSRQYFVTDLMQRKYFDGYQEVPDRRHDTIPWIVKRELGDEVSYRDVCEALGYSAEFSTITEHLHSSSPSSPINLEFDAGDMGDAGFHSRRDSFPTASQAQTGASNVHRPTSVHETPSDYPSSISYSKDMSLIRRQLHQEDSPEATASMNPPTSQSVASQKTKRMIPDRSAKPLGDPDVSRRRRQPHENPHHADLPSTSRGESALSTQSAKRPLPESPTDVFQPPNASRRRQQVRERPSSEEWVPHRSHQRKD